MAKSIALTPRLVSLLQSAAGAEVDVAGLKAFEATALNTRPLWKPGSIFDRGRHTRATLQEMADRLAAGETVPLHTLHQPGAELPVGKVFHAQVHDLPDGEAELRALFYLPAGHELAAAIDRAIVDEVSVGLRHKALLCSECGWDFLGADATPEHFWDRTCAQGHVLHRDGVHLRLAGVDRWLELSLVSKGAAAQARIHSRARALLAAAGAPALAASGLTPEPTVLFAHIQKEPGSMDPKAFMEQLQASAHQAAELKVHLQAAQQEAATLKAQVEAARQEAAALKAQVEADKGALARQVETLTADLGQAQAFLAEQAVKALTAAGTPAPQAPATLAGCIEAIRASARHLHNLLPPGGAAQPADGGATAAAAAPAAALAAFKAR